MESYSYDIGITSPVQFPIKIQDYTRLNRIKQDNLIHKYREYDRFGDMVTISRSMQSIFRLAERIAAYNSTVLISGESGTGKELIARGMHEKGSRSGMPFVPVNCGCIPENLIESELFGYAKGAFTGADNNHKGLFEAANNGTIFLDEVGELSLGLQVKLLRVLQEKEIRLIGDSKTRKINVRVIAATARDLTDDVCKGKFRQDLYYRLNVLPIELPALRERPEDIPFLCGYFIRRFNEKLGKNIAGIAPDAMSILLKHDWHGNVRELENAMERAVVLCEIPIISVSALPPHIIKNALSRSYSLKAAQQAIEKELITKALIETGGNRTKASRLLEISHPSLLNKMKTYEIML